MSTTNRSRPPTVAPPAEPPRERQRPRRRKRIPIGRGPDADQELIDRCLDGEEKAWEQLYVQFHSRLVGAVKFLLGPEGQKVHLVDEIAARVWYALLRDDAKLLARFDVTRNCRLDAFLMGVARMEILRYFRSERRRQAHEMVGGRRLRDRQPVSDAQMVAMLDEFLSTLTDGEREFMEDYLVSLPPDEEEDTDGQEMTDSNIWQRRHRIRCKMTEFFDDI